MSKQFRLHTQYPEPKDLGVGVLSLERDGWALFFAGDGDEGTTILAELKRTRLDIAAKNGILLSGVQPDGHKANGQEKFAYQEWWLVYV